MAFFSIQKLTNLPADHTFLYFVCETKITIKKLSNVRFLHFFSLSTLVSLHLLHLNFCYRISITESSLVSELYVTNSKWRKWRKLQFPTLFNMVVKQMRSINHSSSCTTSTTGRSTSADLKYFTNVLCQYYIGQKQRELSKFCFLKCDFLSVVTSIKAF